MTAKVTWGHGVLNTSVRPADERLIVVGANFWSCDDRTPGYPGLNTAAFNADSVRTILAMVSWLIGRSSGRVLVLCDNATAGEKTYPVSDAPVGRNFGNAFQNVLLQAGYQVTSTGSIGSWTDGGNWDPLSYDLVCANGGLGAASAYHGVTSQADRWDFILSHHGHVLAEVGDLTTWSRYGFASNQAHGIENFGGVKIHFDADGPSGNWRYQRPFTCAQLGDPGAGGSWGTHDYALVSYTTMGLRTRPENVPANTMGGASTIYSCPLQLLRTHGVSLGGTEYDNMGIIGMWSAS